MSYGIELTNKHGKTIVSTEEPYPLLVPQTPVSTNGYAVEVPQEGTDELLFARTQNGESGVIAFDEVVTATDASGNATEIKDKFMGTLTREQYFGAANGVKTVMTRRVNNVVTSPTTTGYGFECYDSSGNVLFSTSLSSIMRIEAVVTLNFGDAYIFDIPSGHDFDDYYVYVRPLRTVSQKASNAGGFFYSGLNYPASIRGCYAHFDDTNERITLMNNGVEGPNDNSGPIWSTQSNFTSFGTFSIFGNAVLNQGIIGRII